MKKIIPIILLFLLASQCYILAQEIVEKSIAVSNKHDLHLDLKFADKIQISTYAGEKVIIHVEIKINDGQDNDKHELDFELTEDGLRITSTLEKDWLKKDHSCWNSTIIYSLKIPDYLRSIKVNSIGGNIEMKGYYGPLNLKTIGGFIDVSWPSEAGVDLRMKSTSGELYTDFNIKFNFPRKEFPIVGYEMVGEYNGGGSKVTLETIGNNIYLRQL